MFSVVEDTGIMWTSCCFLPVFFIFTAHKAGASSISEQEVGNQRETVNAGQIYDYFTNDVVAQKFFISISLQVNVYFKLFSAHSFIFLSSCSSVLAGLFLTGSGPWREEGRWKMIRIVRVFLSSSSVIRLQGLMLLWELDMYTEISFSLSLAMFSCF